MEQKHIPVFTIRLRTQNGIKRFNFDNEYVKFEELQKEINKTYQIPIYSQLIARNPVETSDPQYIIDKGNITFAKLGLKHGDMLYTRLSEQMKKDNNKIDKHVYKKTSRCNHSDNGRCIYCDPSPIIPQSSSKPNPKYCNHGPHAKCLNCINKDKPKDDTPAAWLCNHPDHVFCPKCIPKKENDPNKPQEKTSWGCHCNKKLGQKCIYCVIPPQKFKIDLPSYNQLIRELTSLCHFKHPPNQRCFSCAVPRLPNFKGNPKCTDGHQPWPYGICSKCMPENAILKLQNYRHCSYVSFADHGSFNNWVYTWRKNNFSPQITGILIGTYGPAPDKYNDPEAIQAIVQSIYHPPQICQGESILFQKDLQENTVNRIIESLGLIRVGWIVTSLYRSAAKYGGEMFLSGHDIRQAARFQLQNADADGHSCFVTVNIRSNNENVAFQVSDQCVALERDNILRDSDDIGFLETRPFKKTESLPRIIYKDKILESKDTFLPDEFLVKVIVSEAISTKPFFKYAEFPHCGTLPHFKTYLNKHRKEPFHIGLSDFNLLLFLPKVIGIELTERLCSRIKNNTPLEQLDKNALDRAFREIC